jgi:hypothetical protein
VLLENNKITQVKPRIKSAVFLMNFILYLLTGFHGKFQILCFRFSPIELKNQARDVNVLLGIPAVLWRDHKI